MWLVQAGQKAVTRRSVLASAAGMVLSACAMDHGPKTTDLRFMIDADDFINPNTANVASPVVLRIYELKQLNALSGASLFELLDTDTNVLGPDLVSKREIEVKPGEKVKFDRSTPIETHYIGVIAGFRTLEGATWRASIEITPERSALIVVKLTAQTETINPKEDMTLDFF